jgi:tetratricopeptide (TPR) repeat protein
MIGTAARERHSRVGRRIGRIALAAVVLGAGACCVASLLVQGAVQGAGQGAAKKADTQEAKPRMDTGELRTRLYAISQMIQTGRLDEAEQGIDLLRAESGGDPLIDGMEAFLLYRRHDFSGARTMIEKALKMTEPPTWWHTLDAMCMFAMGDETAAKDTITKSQAEEPRATSESLISMGAAALHDFTQTPSVEGALTLAFLDRTMGSRRSELNVLDSALKRFPKDTRLIIARLNLLGDAATDSIVVLAEIDKAVAAAPDSDVVQGVAGALYDKLAAFDKALPALRKAVQLNPKNHLARLELGNALQHEKKNPEALQEFEVIVSATPPVPPDFRALAYGGMGSALTELKRWPEAEDALQKGMALAPESSVLLNDLAWLYATAEAPVRNPEKAVELASKAATITHNRQPTILDTLAEAYFAAGKPDKAAETERRALLLAPGRADLIERLKKYEGGK